MFGTSHFSISREAVNPEIGSERRLLKPRAQSFRQWSFVFAIVISIVWGLVSALSAGAQPLDRVVESLLENQCSLFEAAGGDTVGLANICGQPPGAGTSSGGGASTPQTAPGIVQERLKEARGEEVDAEAGVVSEMVPGLSLLLSAEYEDLDRDTTTFEDGYDSDIKRFTLGADYLFTDTLMAGLAFTYYNHDGDFDSGGDFDNDSYGLLAFLSIIPHESVFVQATVGYASKEYDRTRQAALKIDSDPSLGEPFDESGPAEGGILAGYDQRMGSLTIGPRLGLDWIYNRFDGYSEQGDTGLELVFEETDEFSLQGRLGLMGSMAVSTGFGVLLPQVNVDWVHEFENDQRIENFSFVDDDAKVKFQYEDEKPDRDFFEVSAGVSAVLPNGWQTLAQYRTILGHDYIDSHVGSLGVRVEF